MKPMIGNQSNGLNLILESPEDFITRFNKTIWMDDKRSSAIRTSRREVNIKHVLNIGNQRPFQ